ncbi:MAG: DUF1905 domain-containing protein [Cytophagales bacterium]
MPDDSALENKIKYQFSAQLWKYDAENAWYFVSLAQKMSEEIRSQLQWQEEGWGKMKAIAKIRDLEWKTSIWFDSKRQCYVLPIKAEIRKKLSLKEKDQLKIELFI